MKKILPVIFFLIIVSIFITNKFNKSNKETILFLGETKYLSKIKSEEFTDYNIKYFLYDDINYNNLIKNIKNNDYYILKDKNIYLNQLINSADYIIINLNNKKLISKCNSQKQFNNYILSKQEEKNNVAIDVSDPGEEVDFENSQLHDLTDKNQYYTVRNCINAFIS